MDGQTWAAGVLVAAAGLYLARATWRTWAGGPSGCGSGCGKCATEPTPEPTGRRIGLPTV